jgi:hypothetical protein
MNAPGRLSVLGFLLAACVAREASAAPSPGETLFHEGKEAMDRQDFATACQKFEASYEQEHVVNSLLAYANCEEQRGHVARALELWQQGIAESKDDDTRKLATERATALRPRVPKLLIRVVQSGLKNTRVQIDGREVVAEREIPVEVGDHVIEATAAGVSPEKVTRHAVEGQTIDVSVLISVPKTPDPKPSSDPGAPLKIAGFVTGGVGIAGLVVFGATGIAVLTDKQCGDFVCPKDQRPQGLLVANAVGLVVGVAGLGAGVTLFLVGNAKSKAQKSAQLELAPIPGGAAIGARFDL